MPSTTKRSRSQSTDSTSSSEDWEVLTAASSSASDFVVHSDVSESASTQDVEDLTPGSTADGHPVDPFADRHAVDPFSDSTDEGQSNGEDESESGAEGEDGEWGSDEDDDYDEESSDDEDDSDEDDSDDEGDSDDGDSSDDEDDGDEEDDSDEDDDSDDEDIPSKENPHWETLIDCIKDQRRGTKVILVTGQPGSGKSTFLRDLTGRYLNTGQTTVYSVSPYPVNPNNPNSAVSDRHFEYQVCEDTIDNQNYLFIELPPFTCTKRDRELFSELMYFVLPRRNFTHCTLVGVFFLFDVAQHRLTPTDIHSIQLFKTLFGPTLFKCMTVVSTKWDQLSKAEFKDKFESFNANILAHPVVDSILNPPPRAVTSTRRNQRPRTKTYGGASFYHHGVILTTTVDADDECGRVDLTIELKRLSVKAHGWERTQIATKMIRQFYGDIKSTNDQLQALRELGGKDYNGQELEATKALKRGIACDGEIKLRIDENDFMRVEPGPTGSGREMYMYRLVRVEREPPREREKIDWEGIRRRLWFFSSLTN